MPGCVVSPARWHSGKGSHLDVCASVEAIELVEKLQHSPLNLPLSCGFTNGRAKLCVAKVVRACVRGDRVGG